MVNMIRQDLTGYDANNDTYNYQVEHKSVSVGIQVSGGSVYVFIGDSATDATNEDNYWEIDDGEKEALNKDVAKTIRNKYLRFFIASGTPTLQIRDFNGSFMDNVVFSR